ncbi:MAG: hypothetical protein HY459_01115 [Parcubacteria group bacterium]|nr:hypothetical protein [Parcubacteria group bacterium]
MKKQELAFTLSIVILKEGTRFIAYAPALDLSTGGTTVKIAKKRIVEAATLFFEEIDRKGTTEEVLSELGWQKAKRQWRPPLLVSRESQSLRVPLRL